MTVFLTENSRLLKSIYPLNEGTCSNIWREKNFAIPDFGDRTLKVNRSSTEKTLRRPGKTPYFEEHSQIFMAKNGHEGAMYAEPLEWVSPTGEKFIGNVVINGKIYSETN